MQKPVPPEVCTRDYYLCDRKGSAEFVESRGHALCPQHARALQLADIRPGHVVLDVGSGCGELTIHAAMQGAKAVGIDYAPSAVALAKEALETFPSELQSRVKFILGLVEDQEMEGRQEQGVDCVFLMDVIEHLHRWQIEQMYAHLYRILKPGGKMICHTWPNRWHTTYVYPIVYRLFRLLGVHKSKEVREPHDEVMHVNQQTAWSVWRDTKSAGFQAKVWMTHESPTHANPVWRWVYYIFHHVFPLSLLFADGIWCIATKKR